MCITKEELDATKASWRNFQKRELKRCAQQSEEGSSKVEGGSRCEGISETIATKTFEGGRLRPTRKISLLVHRWVIQLGSRIR